MNVEQLLTEVDHNFSNKGLGDNVPWAILRAELLSRLERAGELEKERDRIAADRDKSTAHAAECFRKERDLRTAAESRVAEMRKALEEIAAIQNKLDGGDWDEIEQARNIAKTFLSTPAAKGAEK